MTLLSLGPGPMLPRIFYLVCWLTGQRGSFEYTSDLFKSVLDFMPSTSSIFATTQQQPEAITLAFTTHEPSHYDACHRQTRPWPQQTGHAVSDAETDDHL